MNRDRKDRERETRDRDREELRLREREQQQTQEREVRNGWPLHLVFSSMFFCKVKSRSFFFNVRSSILAVQILYHTHSCSKLFTTSPFPFMCQSARGGGKERRAIIICESSYSSQSSSSSVRTSQYSFKFFCLCNTFHTFLVHSSHFFLVFFRKLAKT